MKLVARSLMTWIELPDVDTLSQSAPNLCADVLMLLVRSIAAVLSSFDGRELRNLFLRTEAVWASVRGGVLILSTRTHFFCFYLSAST